jgi:hypothetical protein
MSALPAGFSLDDANSVDSNYLQFVVGLLDDTDNYSDFVGRERADSITEFLRRERADSISDFLKRERQDSITDFLPKQSDFLMRDRAFSWDLNMEEQMHPDKGKGLGTSTLNAPKVETSTANGIVGNSTSDKKRKAEAKAPTVASKAQKSAVKNPPLASKAGSKTIAPPPKAKPPSKVVVPEPNAKRAKISDAKYPPPKSMVQYNMDMSNIVPGAVLGQLPQSLNISGQPQTLTRYDPFSVHMMGHAGMMASALHPLDASCPRIGAYTKEERQVIIAKFRAKKMRRVWRKQIKYDCRKRLADTRPRVKGRFVSRKEREGQEDGKEGLDNENEAGSGDGDYEDD